jgi:dihydrofolate reductase
MSRTPLRRPEGAVAPGPPASGRVHLYVGISLDGYLAAPDGGVAWLEPYADARQGFARFIKTIGSTILGRATYDHAVAGGHADFGMPAYVVTHRPLQPSSSSALAYSGDLGALVARIRREHRGDIWLMGGGTLARAFHDADLIDIWSVAFVPALIGAGLPMFPPGTYGERRLQLTRLHRYESGVVELRYERARAARRRGRVPATRVRGT